jgi:hypothetical protein
MTNEPPSHHNFSFSENWRQVIMRMRICQEHWQERSMHDRIESYTYIGSNPVVQIPDVIGL